MLPRVRRSIIAAFWAFVLFLLAYTALARVADPAAPFNEIGRIHPEIGVAHSIVSMSGSLALLVIVLGGLPILFAALRHALPDGLRGVARLFVVKPGQALRLLGIALLLSLCSLGFLLTTQYLFGPPSSCTSANGCVPGQSPLLLILGFAALIGGLTLLFFVVLAITASFSLAVLRSQFGTGLLRFALAPIGLLALIMVIATVAGAIWTIRLWVDVPQFAASSAGLGDGQTIEVIAVIAAMAVSAIVTAGAFVNGLRASRLRAS